MVCCQQSNSRGSSYDRRRCPVDLQRNKVLHVPMLTMSWKAFHLFLSLTSRMLCLFLPHAACAACSHNLKAQNAVALSCVVALGRFESRCHLLKHCHVHLCICLYTCKYFKGGCIALQERTQTESLGTALIAAHHRPPWTSCCSIAMSCTEVLKT